jgi:O-antigen/teichoic acid export membrane protein
MRVLLAFERQDLAVRFLVITLAVNVVSNLVLIPWLGGIGAAAARVFSSAAFWWISWRHARHYVKPVVRAKEYLPLAMATLLCTGLILLGRHWSLFVVIPAGMVTYMVVLWRMGGIPLELKGAIQRQIKGRFNV